MKLVTIGDSITKGTFTDIGDNSPISSATPYGEHLKRLLNADEFINYGFNGISYSKTSKINSEYSLENKIASYELGDILIVAAGTNDFGTDVTIDNFEKAVNYVFSYIKGKCKNVYVLSPLLRGDMEFNNLHLTLNQYSEVLFKKANEFNFNFIDGSLFTLNPLIENVRHKYIKDGVHLNNEAHELLAKYIFNTMNERIDEFEFNGYKAIVKIPANFNGEWIWKTEFFYAFDALERELYNDGFARVYYAISDKYGSPNSIKLMYEFYNYIIEKYKFNPKCFLVGFSRGGLYAFNFALKHPECVKKLYLDAPVLDLRTWPRRTKKFDEIYLYEQVLIEYNFTNKDEYLNYKHYPVYEFKKYFSYKIPTLLVAGKNDTTVSFYKNANKMIKFALSNNLENFYYYVKEGLAKDGGDHHPHSFGNVGMKLIYGCNSPSKVNVYSNVFDSDSKLLDNDFNLIKWFFYD